MKKDHEKKHVNVTGGNGGVEAAKTGGGSEAANAVKVLNVSSGLNTAKVTNTMKVSDAPSVSKKSGGQKIEVKTGEKAKKVEGAQKKADDVQKTAVKAEVVTVKTEEKGDSLSKKSAHAGVNAQATHGKRIDGVVRTDRLSHVQKTEEKAELEAEKEEVAAKVVEPVAEVGVKKPAKSVRVKATLLAILAAMLVGAVGLAVVWICNDASAERCTVTFEAKGGTTVEMAEVVCGSRVSEPEEPEREGYEFMAWLYRGKAFDFAEDTVDTDMTLVAKWAKVTEDGELEEEEDEEEEEYDDEEGSTESAGNTSSTKTTSVSGSTKGSTTSSSSSSSETTTGSSESKEETEDDEQEGTGEVGNVTGDTEKTDYCLEDAMDCNKDDENQQATENENENE